MIAPYIRDIGGVKWKTPKSQRTTSSCALSQNELSFSLNSWNESLIMPNRDKPALTRKAKGIKSYQAKQLSAFKKRLGTKPKKVNYFNKKVT